MLCYSIGGAENLKRCGVFEPTDDLKVLVRRGIPVAFRNLVWSRISMSSTYRAAYPSDYFKSLLNRVDTEVPKKVASDIEKDVDRTFPEHEYFGMTIGIDSLRRVLLAFSLHQPDIGYCQSLNFVAGMMLLFCEEEDAFYLLATTIQALLPPDYYTQTMVGTYVDQMVLMNLIKSCMPNVHKKLLEASKPINECINDIPAVEALNDVESNPVTASVTVQWFLCMFVNTLRPEVCLRVWDIFFNEGSKVLFKIAIALFKHAEKKILHATDWGSLLGIIRNIGSDIVDADHLIGLAYAQHLPTKVSRWRSSLKMDFNNPRLRNPDSIFGRVPSTLTGIGCAHLGPDLTAAVATASINDKIDDIDTANTASTSSITTVTAAEDITPDTTEQYEACTDEDIDVIAVPDNALDNERISLGNNRDSVSSTISIESSPYAKLSRVKPVLEAPHAYPPIPKDISLCGRFEMESLQARQLVVKEKTKTARRRSSIRFKSSDIDAYRSKFRPTLEEYLKNRMKRK